MPLDCVTVGPAEPSGVLIWLHGLGADGHDFEPVVPVLQRPDLRVVLPHAPVRPVTVNHGYPGRSWYDIRHLEPGPNRESVEDIRASAVDIGELIAAQVAAGVPANRIALVGFSQGGAMALHVALRWPDRLAGVVALSTYLVLEDTMDGERAAVSHGMSAFFAHGSQDGVVPMARGRAAHDRLADSTEATWSDYPMGHAVCAEEIDVLAAWIDRVLPME